MTWLVLVVRLAGSASRHRVAVWRELRRAGAAPVAQGVWTVPDTPFFVAAVHRARALATRGEGDILMFAASTGDTPSEKSLVDAFRGQRLDEWAEFDHDCGKFEAEIAKEIRINKFTLAELEEEEQSLDRLRRWYRDLKGRDVLGLPEAAASEERLARCTALLDDYAELVYSGLHAQDTDQDTDPAQDTVQNDRSASDTRVQDAGSPGVGQHI